MLLLLPLLLCVRLVPAQIFLPFNFQANLGEILQKLQTLEHRYQAETPDPPTAPPALAPYWKEREFPKEKSYPKSLLNGLSNANSQPAQWRPPTLPGREDSTTTTTRRFVPVTTPPPPTTTTSSAAPITLPSTTASPTPTMPLGLASCEPGKRCYVRLRSFESDVSLFQYAYTHSSPTSALIQAVFDSTKGTTLPAPLSWNVTVAPEIVQLSLNLMQFSKPNRVLVVGVFTGLAVIGAATAINERGLVVGIEDPRHSEYWQLIGNKYAQQAGLMRRIQIRSEFPIPEALDQLSRSEPGSFDFAILDDPVLENYLVEYEKCLMLMRSGAMLLINDAYAFGEVLSGPGMRSSKGDIMDQVNRKVKTDPRVTSTFLPIGNGVLMVVKK